MRRILSLVVVAWVMAAMMVAMAMPAFAKIDTGDPPPGPPTLSGNPSGTTVVHCNSDEIGEEGAVAINKNGAHGGGDCL